MIVDASVVAAGLLEEPVGGHWARSVLGTRGLAAPHLLPAEVTNLLRRHTARRMITARDASAAARDLIRLPIELYSFDLVAERVWELRETVTAYDAWYVALAEALDVPLATLDVRLTRAPGPRCRFEVPA